MIQPDVGHKPVLSILWFAPYQENKLQMQNQYINVQKLKEEEQTGFLLSGTLKNALKSKSIWEDGFPTPGDGKKARMVWMGCAVCAVAHSIDFEADGP